jgi:ABC-type Mn2+/Zn2+ transport system permease subunit
MGTALMAVFLGIWLSFRFDFPSGPMIVAVLGGQLLMGAAYRVVAR